MKTLRLFVATLMIATAALHVVPMFGVPKDPNAIPMLGFGIVYFGIGLLLFMNKNVSEYLGVVFPAIGLAIGFFQIGVSNWNTLLTAMFLIDAVVIVCCIILIMNRKRLGTESQ